jgi:hypothetical protein
MSERELTARLLDLLRQKIAEEPTAPDLDVHVGSHLELVARQYDEWQRSVTGLRLLCGVRLVNEALRE